ncbi:MAG: hypothetical protein Q9180_001239 [Flavoplaca navasiana]
MSLVIDSEQIQAYKLRGSLPHAIESTWYITEAILNDVTNVPATTVSALALRSNYCTAFCRFVTGLLDSSQESYHKVSMYDKARTLELPASFVELRHEAIHGELPSLVVLRQAIQKALDWLQTNYWTQVNDEDIWVDADQSCSVREYMATRVDLRNIVQHHTNLHVSVSPQREGDIDDESRLTVQSVLRLLEHSERGKQATADFVDVLLNHWLLYTSSDNNTAVMPDARCNGSENDQWTNAIYSCWDPILRLLAVKRPLLLRMLSAVMIKHLTAQHPLASSAENFQKLMFAGLSHIYTAPDWRKLYRQSGLNGLEIVSRCLQSPNRWTVRLAALISDCPHHVRVKNMFAYRISQTMKSLDVGSAAGKSADDVPGMVGHELC